jgi:putative Holliday junction resolvase
MSGAESSQAQKVRRLGELLQAATGIPVEYRDERLSTVEAGRVLKQAELSIEKTRQAIDRLSAVLILQGYLDQQAEEAERAAREHAGSDGPDADHPDEW